MALNLKQMDTSALVGLSLPATYSEHVVLSAKDAATVMAIFASAHSVANVEYSGNDCKIIPEPPECRCIIIPREKYHDLRQAYAVGMSYKDYITSKEEANGAEQQST